ncbi:IS5 family transposase [Streptomyces halobius]|uniref:IS5 family transposase n=1 Tax=Streptomyces halobius TaxID=2879846 RepID=A0ABY4M2N0_9ACTN|nr:IS5 family transposase [Streptomyces halobius]
MGRGDLSEAEWARLEPYLPTNGKRGGQWKSHRKVVNGIYFRERTGVPWRDLPARFGKWKTVHDRHRRWSADGTWDRILSAVQADGDAEERLDWSQTGVDSTSCRAHQHAAGARKGRARQRSKKGVPAQHREDGGLGRSRGGLTSKIHLACEGGLRPLALLVTPGQTHDGTVFEAVVERIRVPRQGGGHPRTRPYAISADKAYSSRRIRSYLRRRQIPHAIPEKKDQARHRLARGSAGGRPPGFDRAAYKRRNEVERTINALKAFRAVATRFDKRAYVFHGTVTVAAIRLWLWR